MPKSLIEVTSDAFKVLEEAKSEGYSFKRLASEAIIEKYGKPKHSMWPVQTHDGLPGNKRWLGIPKPTADEYRTAIELISKYGHPIKAINSLNGDNVENKQLAIAITEIASAGGGYD